MLRTGEVEMRRARAVPVAVLVAVSTMAALMAGCTSRDDQSSSSAGGRETPSSHTMPDGTVMQDSKMGSASSLERGGRDGSARQPSVAARMVCSDEIATAVRHTLELPAAPVGAPSWDHLLYTCVYPIGDGSVRLAVKDLSDPVRGRAWFTRLRREIGDVEPIAGLQNFGFPALETPHGDVVFLKDHKTLWVDAGNVPRDQLPAGVTPTDAAYGIAAAVVACWTE